MRLVVKIPDEMGKKLKKIADGHPVYDGNVSALIRSLAVSFFAQQDTSKCLSRKPECK